MSHERTAGRMSDSREASHEPEAAADAIRLEDVTVVLGGQRVLNGFDLAVRRGERVLLVGPPGCGKTTVLRCILGFVVPASGQVFVDGQPLTARTVWSLRRKLGYVAQDPEPGPGTVREALERPLQFRANAHLRENIKRVPELLDAFGLPADLLDQQVSTLSGGQRQLVALVQALLLDRPIMLLDEPTSNLDEATARRVAEYFASREGLTVLAVTHQPERFDIGARLQPLGG